MLFTVAWRNIWRSRTRSLVVIVAIVLGIWALAFMLSFTVGLVRSYVDSAIEYSISHLQAHHPLFSDDQELRYHFTGVAPKLDSIRAIPQVDQAAARTLVSGMLSTGRTPRGVVIRGIDPQDERSLTKLDTKVTTGDYLADSSRNQVLLSTHLAAKLQAKVRSKVVLTFQALDGQITAGAFRVAGLFDTGNTPFDEGNVYVRRADLNRLLGADDLAHELAVYLHQPADLDTAQAQAQAVLPGLLVENYRQISPDVQLYESQIQTSAYIFITIIMLALLFGIVNTMLMAVLERYHELGMLMAIGMNKAQIFLMIVLETLLLAGVALLPGLLLSWLTVSWLQHQGIDLSAFSRSMEQYGLSSVVYPSLDLGLYLQFSLGVALTAIVGAIYPALRAIRLRPVEAIRN